MMNEEDENPLVAYTTVEGEVHGVTWRDWMNSQSDLVLMCTRRRAGTTRRTGSPEVITCLTCLVRAFA